MSTIKLAVLGFILSAFLRCSSDSPESIHLEKVELCKDTVKECYYSIDMSLFNNKLYVMGRKTDTIVVYDIARKSTFGIHIDSLPGQGNHILVDAAFIYISCDNLLYFYKHSGEFVKTLPFPFNGQLGYFFVSKNRQVLGFWRDKMFLFDAKGKLVKEQVNPIDYDVPHTSDGMKVYCGNDTHLYSFTLTRDSVITDTISVKTLIKDQKAYYLSCATTGQLIWYDYFRRDSLFIFNKSMSVVEKKIYMGSMFKPTRSDIELETGVPFFTVIPNSNELILVRSFTSTIDIYKVEF